MTFCVCFLSASGANEKPFRRVLHFGLYSRTFLCDQLSLATTSPKRPPIQHQNFPSLSVFVWTPCGRDFRYFRGIQDSLGFWLAYLGFWIPGTRLQSLSVELGFRIPIVSRIPDSLNCIPDSKAQEYRFSSISDFLDSGSGFP